jgi:probable phosphoglycerate mutase
VARRLVVEADGASRGNPGKASYGALVRDADTGELLVEHAARLGTATNNVAEYEGLVAGLSAAHDIAADADVEVRMDSKLVIEQMSGNWQIKHPAMRQLAARARRAHPGPGSVRYKWMPRAENTRADRLANEALDGTGTAVPYGATPPAGGVSAEPADEPSDPAGGPAAAPVGWAKADLGVPTTLLLLRHGSTPLTPEKRLSGIGDPELSALGYDQATAAAKRFAATGGVDAVVSSPATRAKQTARAVADALNLSVRVEYDLHEMDFGAWEGLTMAEVRDRWPRELDAWLADAAVAPPEGESRQAAAARACRARDRLLERYRRRTVLVVTHVTPIKALICDALAAPLDAMFRMELSPASLSAVAYFADGVASVRLVNDTSHVG